MKKIDVLLYHRERDAFLKALRDLGTVHVEEKPETSSEDLSRLSTDLKTAEQVLSGLSSRIKQKKLKKTPAAKNDLPAEKVISEYLAVDKHRQSLEQKISGLEKDEALLSAWGDFDPAQIKNLLSVGVKIRFFEIPSKSLEELKTSVSGLTEVASIGSKIFCVLFERGEPAVVDADEVKLPEISLTRCRENIRDFKANLLSVLEKLDELLGYRGLIASRIEFLKSDVSFESARLSFGEEAGGKVLRLSGWLPAKNTAEVGQKLSGFKAWYEISDPGQGEEPPVHFKNDAFSRLFEPILKLYSLPGYKEIDPTPFFAPFLMLFVGLCVGDMAYGLIILIASLIVYFSVKKPVKPFAALGIVLGASIMACGFLLNSFFCVTLLGNPANPGPSIFRTGSYLAIFSPFPGKTGTIYPMMSFALLIGFFQLMLAFVVRIFNKVRTSGLSGAAVPISFILITLGGLSYMAHTNTMNLGVANFAVSGIKFGSLLLLIPKTAALVMLAVAVPLNVIFSNNDKKGGVRWTMVFVDFYNGVTGIMGNILSYMRLFALGLTGGLLGGVFNSLAMGFITRPDGTVNFLSPFIVFSVILMVFGHTLNFLLAIIGAGVHPLRLTFVEFLQNLDYSWGGKPYKPLKKA